MLVDVVPLRHGVVPRPREEVLADAPMRGELALDFRMGRPDRAIVEPDVTARLKLQRGDMLELRSAVVTKMRGDSFLVYGTELILPRGIGGSRQTPQVWWCRVVRDALEEQTRKRSPNALPTSG